MFSCVFAGVYLHTHTHTLTHTHTHTHTTHPLHSREEEVEAVAAQLQVEHDDSGLRERLEVKLDLGQLPGVWEGEGLGGERPK